MRTSSRILQLAVGLLLLIASNPGLAAQKSTPVRKMSSVVTAKSKQKPLESRETIRTYEEFMRLSQKERGIYLVGVEGVLNALSDTDKDLKTEYQSADARWDLINSIFNVAKADDGSDRRCIYAGSVSEMDINGRYCMRPKDQGCAPKITCNPLLYGAARCVPGGSQAKFASRNCARIAKPLNEVIKDIEGKREEWEALRKDLAGYCESPRPSQKGLCLTVKARLARVEAILPSQADSEPAPSASVPASAPATEVAAPAVETQAAVAAAPVSAPTTDSAIKIRALPAKTETQAAQPAAQSAAPASGETVTEDCSGPIKRSTIVATSSSSGSVPAVTKAGSVCSRSFLLGDLKNENDQYTYGLNLMSIGEAQDLMCTTGAIGQEWIDEVRKMLRYKLSQLGNVPARYRNNEKSEIEKTSANFEACLNDAFKIRAGKVVSDPYPNGGTIQISGYDSCQPSYKQNPKSISAVFTNSAGKNLGTLDVGHMGAWIEKEQISVCKIRIGQEQRKAGSPMRMPSVPGGARSGSGR